VGGSFRDRRNKVGKDKASGIKKKNRSIIRRKNQTWGSICEKVTGGLVYEEY